MRKVELKCNDAVSDKYYRTVMHKFHFAHLFSVSVEAHYSKQNYIHIGVIWNSCII